MTTFGILLPILPKTSSELGFKLSKKPTSSEPVWNKLRCGWKLNYSKSSICSTLLNWFQTMGVVDTELTKPPWNRFRTRCKLVPNFYLIWDYGFWLLYVVLYVASHSIKDKFWTRLRNFRRNQPVQNQFEILWWGSILMKTDLKSSIFTN